MANIKGIELASEIYDLEDEVARNTAASASQTATSASQTATSASQTATQASQTATQASQTATQADEKIGDLASLKTAIKTSVVEAINELLTPITLPLENIVLNDDVTAETSNIQTRAQAGSVQTGVFYFRNLNASGVGGTTTVHLGTCSIRPKTLTTFMGLDYGNNAIVRLGVTTEGVVELLESYGVVPGSNIIRAPYVISV